MSIATNSTGVHIIQVRTPSGAVHDLSELDATGLRRATRIATALAGWLPVDEWEVASRFVPVGVRKLRKSLVRDIGNVDLDGCVIEVARPTDDNVRNGYEVVAAFHVGAVEPTLLHQIRSDAREAGWRSFVPEVNYVTEDA